MEKSDWKSFIGSYIFNLIIIIITLFLIFIYIKTKDLHSYPCYFNILLSLSISLDNILRLIPFFEDDFGAKPNDRIGCKIQGFLLSMFDKLMLTTMTIYSIITYCGMIFFNFYKSHEKCLYITLTIFAILISLTLSIIFMLNGVTNYDDVCYVKAEKGENDDEELVVNKKLIDIIATSILLAINIYCIIHTLVYLLQQYKDLKTNEEKKAKKYLNHFWKYLADLILTILTFLMVLLIIMDKFFDNDNVISMSYVGCSLLVVIFFTINMRVLKEAKRIILCQKTIGGNKSSIEEEIDEDNDGIEISNMKSELVE